MWKGGEKKRRGELHRERSRGGKIFPSLFSEFLLRIKQMQMVGQVEPKAKACAGNGSGTRPDCTRNLLFCVVHLHSEQILWLRIKFFRELLIILSKPLKSPSKRSCPPSYWQSCFPAANGETFVITLISKPISIRLFPDYAIKHQVYGSDLPGKDLLLGFGVLQTSSIHWVFVLEKDHVVTISTLFLFSFFDSLGFFLLTELWLALWS